MTNLLPCPFCGDEPAKTPGSGAFYIQCTNDACDIQPGVEMQDTQRAIDAWNKRARPEAMARKGWCIRHADEKRWRTMDTIGMPDWTADPAKALVCRLKEHVEAYAADDDEDIRIVEVSW